MDREPINNENIHGTKDFKEAKFDSFLNKTIILSARKHFEKERLNNMREQKIIDDENYTEYFENALKHEDSYIPTNEEDLIQLCENEKLSNALKKLSNIEMTVLFLLCAEELSNIEISIELQQYLTTISKIKKRALRKLAKYLKGDEDFE